MYRDNVSRDGKPPGKPHWLKRLLRAYIRFDDKTGYSPRFNWALSNRFGDEDKEPRPPRIENAEISAEEREAAVARIKQEQTIRRAKGSSQIDGRYEGRSCGRK